MLHTSSITQIVFFFLHFRSKQCDLKKKKTREREKQILVFYACEF